MHAERTRAWVVVDLGFGDSGKGTIVDYLVRARSARLVVRWNGGAQAGHTVVTDDGREHVFSQLGAGTFVPGVRTHLAEDFVLHPTALLVEARHLAKKGVTDAMERLTIAESARVITPFHQAANRLRELARGASLHGTCGVGFGEAVRDALVAPEDIVRASDLAGRRVDRTTLARKLSAARERLVASLGGALDELRANPRAAGELAILSDVSVATRWLTAVEPLRAMRALVVADEALGPMLDGAATVLEGAQGMLLDERHGFHPHTTWSDCTTTGASALLACHGFAGPVERLGVLRTYLTRHGEGPFPSEAPELSTALPERHNAGDGWQGAFRVGYQDLVLLRYALRASGGVDGLALTHADRLCSARRLVHAYEGATDPSLFAVDSRERAVDLRACVAPDTDAHARHQERLSRALRRVRTVTEEVDLDADAFASRLGEALGAHVAIVSSGPSAAAKRER